jgi:hypothetical protein
MIEAADATICPKASETTRAQKPTIGLRLIRSEDPTIGLSPIRPESITTGLRMIKAGENRTTGPRMIKAETAKAKANIKTAGPTHIIGSYQA